MFDVNRDSRVICTSPWYALRLSQLASLQIYNAVSTRCHVHQWLQDRYAYCGKVARTIDVGRHAADHRVYRVTAATGAPSITLIGREGLAARKASHS